LCSARRKITHSCSIRARIATLALVVERVIRTAVDLSREARLTHLSRPSWTTAWLTIRAVTMSIDAREFGHWQSLPQGVWDCMIYRWRLERGQSGAVKTGTFTRFAIRAVTRVCLAPFRYQRAAHPMGVHTPSTTPTSAPAVRMKSGLTRLIRSAKAIGKRPWKRHSSRARQMRCANR
jgi:hypothetical protein